MAGSEASGWSAYVKNILTHAPCVKRAAIVGATDGAIWACTDGKTGDVFQATAEELKNFVALFDHVEDVPQHGFHLEGKKYIVPQVAENLIFGKKDKAGVFAVKTKLAVLIACFDGDSMESVTCRKAVDELGAYLCKQGY
ncbi:unnamed protein product [Soboliphyme baturini]|uniref:Profilin n=1 Tax=Soboliphyme baturini TaxID=241478 RepID=A0A183ISJ4_9BILA|nr:unnamed protein product [Soboliphyme baturini]